MIFLLILTNLGIDIAENLFPNLLTLVTQLAVTGILLFIFTKFLYKPVIRWLDARVELLQADLNEAKAHKEDAVLLKEKAEEFFESADQKAYEIVEKGRQEAVKQKDQILAQARNEAQEQLKKAQLEIASERKDMMESVQQEIVDVALAATEQLLETEVSETTHRKAVDEFIASLRS